MVTSGAAARRRVVLVVLDPLAAFELADAELAAVEEWHESGRLVWPFAVADVA